MQYLAARRAVIKLCLSRAKAEPDRTAVTVKQETGHFNFPDAELHTNRRFALPPPLHFN